MGAEALLGQGDMLYMPPGSGYPQRVHGAFVSDQEVHRVAEYLKAQGEPNYIEGVLTSLDEQEAGGELEGGGADAESDALYDQAVEIVLKSRRASISLVQRHLRIGYNRAARLVVRAGDEAALKGCEARLREAGVGVVQADDPEKCQYLRAGGEEVGSRDLLWAALKAMMLALPYSAGEGAAKVREEFTKVIFGVVNERRELAKAIDSVESQDGLIPV